MNKNTKFTSGAIFLLSVAVGFGTTKYKMSQSQTEQTSSGGTTASVSHNNTIAEGVRKPDNKPKREAKEDIINKKPIAEEVQPKVEEKVKVVAKQAEIIVAEEPAQTVQVVCSTVVLNGQTYSMNATYGGKLAKKQKVHYELRDNSGHVIKSYNGKFTNIKPTKDGTYTLCLVDNKTNKVLDSKEVSGFKVVEVQTPPSSDPVKPQMEKMSAGEFNRLLLNSGDVTLLGKKNKKANPKVSEHVSFSFEGMRGDRRPDDVQDIRDKIAFGTWMSAEVLSVGYDATGKINSAKIRPVYPEE